MDWYSVTLILMSWVGLLALTLRVVRAGFGYRAVCRQGAGRALRNTSFHALAAEVSFLLGVLAWTSPMPDWLHFWAGALGTTLMLTAFFGFLRWSWAWHGIHVDELKRAVVASEQDS